MDSPLGLHSVAYQINSYQCKPITILCMLRLTLLFCRNRLSIHNLSNNHAVVGPQGLHPVKRSLEVRSLPGHALVQLLLQSANHYPQNSINLTERYISK